MIDQLNKLVYHWWLGLRRPWARTAQSQSVVHIVDGQLTFEASANNKHGQGVLLRVPAEQMLSSRIPTRRMSDDIDQLAQELLPFSSNELYATRDKQILYAALKKDVSVWLDQALQQDLNITGLLFDGSDGSTALNLEIENSSSKPIAVLLTAVLSLFLISSLLLQYRLGIVHNEVTNNLEKMAEMQRERAPAIPTQSETLNFSVNAAESALSSLQTNLPIEAELNQISLTVESADEQRILIVIDAQANSGAALLGRLEASDTFTDSEFIGAISTNPNAVSERFRIQTRYPLVRADDPQDADPQGAQ